MFLKRNVPEMQRGIGMPPAAASIPIAATATSETPAALAAAATPEPAAVTALDGDDIDNLVNEVQDSEVPGDDADTERASVARTRRMAQTNHRFFPRWADRVR